MNLSTNAAPRSFVITAVATAALTLTVSSPQDASAMTVMYAELPELVNASELVLYGKVIDVKVIDRRKAGRAVWTEFTLSVLDVWKGDRKTVGKVFRWRHLGGSTADGMTLHVPGMPTFSAGEETVVLLERHSEGHVLTGAAQGKFTVSTNAKGQKFATRHLGGVNLVRRAANGRLVGIHGKHRGHGPQQLMPPPEATQPIATLRKAIMEWVAADAAKPKLRTPAAPTARKDAPVRAKTKVKR